MPGWATGAIVLVALVGVAAGIINMVGSQGRDFQAVWSRYERVRKEEPARAREILEELLLEDLTADERKLVNQQLLATKPEVAKIDDYKRNADISKWLEARLYNYHKNFDVTTERPHARLFLKRANWFMKEYPTHPDRERVQRLIDRVTPVAELGSPTTFDDVDREVWGEIAPSPKDFTEAFRVIDAFVSATSDPDEKAKAETLRAETLTAEKEFFDQKLADAAVVYDKQTYPDKYDPRTAFHDMVIAVTSVHTPEMRADAARRMLGISEITPEYIEGYKRDRPDRWASMMTEPSLKAYAKQHGLD